MDKHAHVRVEDGYVYTPYITRNGKRIYPKNGGVFRFRDRRYKR